MITSKMEASIKMKYLATGGEKNGYFVEGKGRLYKGCVSYHFREIWNSDQLPEQVY